jgi:hypothetical protein
MFVSEGRGFVFVHIPKTGGTALTLALEARAQARDVIIGDTPKARARKRRLAALPARGRLWKHSTLADLDGWIGPADLGQMFVLTLVRNPWDRMVSYYHWLQAQTFAHPAVQMAKASAFSAFLNHPQIRASLQAWPYRAWMCDADGVDRCTLYARLEQPEQDLSAFEAMLGFALTPFPRSNESHRNRDWRGYYSDDDAALLAGLCAEDIARFGYRFDPAG